MLPNTHYQNGTVDFLPGDILAIVTDGLTEVFDFKGHELGDTYIGTAVASLASLPLSEISEDILRFARAFGKTTEDQTLLLLLRREIELRPR